MSQGSLFLLEGNALIKTHLRGYQGLKMTVVTGPRRLCSSPLGSIAGEQ